ncbi:hypothetical protein LCGC14_1411290 [marine sediment metagenome]|uniref:Uncharacterized protein n=1 Tax=marine sediment metagenome TaxID=412755 RepID=A0A0F9KF95_9ZZZZ
MKKPKLRRQVDIVAVYWSDAYGCNSWETPESIDEFVERIAQASVTVGVFERYTSKAIVVSRVLSGMRNSVEGIFYIPLCMVDKIVKKGRGG